MGQDPRRSKERQSLRGRYAGLPNDRRWDVRQGSLGQAGRKPGVCFGLNGWTALDLSSTLHLATHLHILITSYAYHLI